MPFLSYNTCKKGAISTVNEQFILGITRYPDGWRRVRASKASESHVTYYYSPKAWTVQMLVSYCADINDNHYL